MKAKLELKEITSVDEIGETTEHLNSVQQKYKIYEVTKYQITLRDGQQITLPAEIVTSISTEG